MGSESIAPIAAPRGRDPGGMKPMSSRPSRSGKAVSSRQPAGPASALRRALMRRKKAELVEVLIELAELDRGLLRQLTARFDVTTSLSPGELLSATCRAIVDATHFDTRQINRNFAYDHAAYGEVKRNLSRLIGSGQLRQAMTLALDLMKRGSYQVEMSDEGLMTGEIEECLGEVIGALKTCDLPASEVLAWCSTMQKTDRVGFIAREPIEALQSHWRRIAAIEPSRAE